MTSRPFPSQCSLSCKHWISPLDVGDGSGEVQTCTAFPGGIPDAIWWNRFDHRQPFLGDGGIRWESNGAAFPDWAMNDEQS